MDGVVHCKLIANHSPIGNRTAIPFFVEFSDPEKKQFQQGILVGESALFGNLAEAGIDTLNSVGGVHDFANSAAIVEQLGHMTPVSKAYVNGSGIGAPGNSEALKFSFRRRKRGSTVDFLQMGGKAFVFFRRDIPHRITDQMDDAALDDYIRKDRARQKKLCKSRQATAKETGANQVLACAEHRLT